MADKNTARVPLNTKLASPLEKLSKDELITPEGGVLGFISQFGNRTKFVRVARSLGVRIHGELVRKWIVNDVMSKKVYETLRLAARDTAVVQGDTFIEVSFKGVLVGQFYLNPDVALVVKKMRVK